ncbi:hypothetical protein BST81_04595 [Leptolyngbya sp. 'hensonii']|uniref:class I SAM-dependent methyltransferase n=1 Tax=Leptolyngbya sp. 'hensonii' TaxID=1922337 RepID=UPI00094F98D8|nr:class I SAM-dependent methyltransferase [Leptolyngbya sp. 'hensonii']OLP19554.1 hypothetical protein BST81_04595 [Leptolyngbya sp. 'hensonii']
MSSYNPKVEAQFDECPYPNLPADRSLTEDDVDYGMLLANSITTAYYMRDRRVVFPTDHTILVAGCGSAWEMLKVALINPGATFVGIDISAASIQLAIERFKFHGIPDTRFQTLAIENVSALAEQFDFMICSDVLYYLDDPAAGLASLKSALKPQGILRVNLHSLYQRQLILNMQKAMELCGILNEPASKAVPLLWELMGSLRPESLVKNHWDSQTNTLEDILVNYLARNDKGFTVPDLFALLEQTGMEFINMVDWYRWDLNSILRQPIPYANAYLQTLNLPQRLHFTELIYPNLTRLLDCWCGHPQYKPAKVFLDQDWWYGTLYAHPLLYQSFNISSVVDDALKNYAPLQVWKWPTVEGGVTIDAVNLRWLAPVFREPTPVQALVTKAQEVLDMPSDLAFLQVMTVLKGLEQTLVMLLESPFL